MSNKKHKHNNTNKPNIKVVDSSPKLWCEECKEEDATCKGKCKLKK